MVRCLFPIACIALAASVTRRWFRKQQAEEDKDDIADNTAVIQEVTNYDIHVMCRVPEAVPVADDVQQSELQEAVSLRAKDEQDLEVLTVIDEQYRNSLCEETARKETLLVENAAREEDIKKVAD